jgi:predicted branched-subunit amino acid permease
MQLLHEGAAPVVALVAALVVNARFAVYSAGLARWFPSASRRQRMLLALPLVDQVFMTATAEFERRPMDDRQRRAFYLGAASHFALAWVAGQTAGLLIGDRVPEWLGLHTASVLALVGLLATSIRHRPACTAAVVAAAVAVAGSHLPAHAAVLVATIAGITVGAARRPS